MAIAFTLSMFVQNKVSATHLAGADMTYVHLGGNMYELTVTLYRDCDGVDAPSSQPVTFESQSCGFSDEIDLFPIPGTGQEVTFPCVGAATTCNGGSVPGLQKWVYRDTVTLPQSCDDWVFHFDRCCRNCAITTIDVTGCTATAPDMYIETNLDNQNYPNNTSPQFTNTPILYVCLNQPFTYNHGVIDPDGDSLAYSLIAPLQSATTTVDYLPGYSATNPISSSPPVAVDAITGDISLTPTALEVGVIAVLVEEYRNGVLIGSVIRDMQIWVQNCNNDLPTATGIDSTGDYSIVVCPNQQLCFDIFTDDINAGQNITMSWNAGIPDGTFVINNNGTPNPSATFCWTPNNSDINLLTHTFTVTVQDDNCPTNGVQVYSYNIFVPSPYFTLSTTDVSCHGGSDGSAIATPVVTNSPYTYTWSDGQTGQVATGLSAGTYTITVNDTAGCTVVETVVIGEPAPISVTSSVTDASCSGSCDGMVDITVSGDHPPFTYQWSDGSTSEDLNNACPGTYTVIVTDANGCSEDLSVTVGTAGGVLNVNVFTEDESCDGACDGIIELTPTGTGPFTYQWSTGGTSHLETGLCPGTYWFTVTEAGGCSFSDTVVIESGAPFSVTHNVTDITCGGACDGAIEIVSTGSGSFTYQWSTGGSGNIEDGLCPGVYWYTVTNADGCTYTDTVEIEEGDPFTVNTLSLIHI